MRRLPLIGGALAIVLVGLAAACGSDPVSKTPFSPAPGVAGLQISGPATIAPGQSVQFIAETRLSDGAVKSTTSAPNVRWRSSNTSILLVNASGLVTAGQNGGEAILTAEVTTNVTIRGTKEILIVPDGTYRVVGSVRELDAPTQGISGARVEVVGTSVVATTDSFGNYRLYGVPPSAEIRITASGYQTVSQTVQLTAHATQNFLLPLNGPRLSLNGPFYVKFDVGACSGVPPLSPDLQHRSYEAFVTTNGSFVTVLLTEPRFRSGSDRFSGRADSSGVKFALEFSYTYYGYNYVSPNVVERLSNNTYLAFFGTAVATGTNAGVSGPLGGRITNYDSRYPAFNSSILGNCQSGIQLTLTPR